MVGFQIQTSSVHRNFGNRFDKSSASVIPTRGHGEQRKRTMILFIVGTNACDIGLGKSFCPSGFLS